MTYARWGDAVNDLLSGKVAEAECLGKTHTRNDALRCLGYDGAQRRGMLAEYKAEILGIHP